MFKALLSRTRRALTKDRALSSLTGSFAETRALRLARGDVAVIEVPGIVCPAMHRAIHQQWREVFPDHKLIILEKGAKISVLSADDNDIRGAA